jgi:hypothetical protein
MNRTQQPAALNARTARRATSDELWAIVHAVESKFVDMRTPYEVKCLKAAKAELDRRATATFAKYFVGIF